MVRSVTTLLLCGLCLSVGAQEREVPKDSLRVSIPGCSKNRRFVTAERPGHEPVRSDIQPGRRFRLNGPKKLLQDIKVHEGSMIEVTGLIRKVDLAERGIGIAGGRIRIGGALPRARMGGTDHVGADPGYTEVVIDVESWRQLTEPCAEQ